MSASAVRAVGRPRVVVVGGGLAGLAVARELVGRGVAVTVLERNAEAGGLARSFRYDGWRFDVGPHRLTARGERVRQIVKDALGGEVVEAPTAWGFRAFGKTHGLPLRGALRSLPLKAMLHGAWDLVHRQRPEEDSYESELVAAYGRTLYEQLFRRATERFLGTPADRIDAEWARAGLANVHRQQAGDGLYPRLGMGALAGRLVADVVVGGGRVLLGREVSGIEVAGGRVVSVVAGGDRFGANAVVWTAPVTLALRLLGSVATGLRYLSTVVFNVALREPSTLRHAAVCYADDERFVRVSDPTAFSGEAAPEGRGALCVECVCREGDALWEEPSRQVPQILVGLAVTGAMRSVRSVDAVYPERVPDTFPVYERGYREELRGAMASLARFRNLVLAGRSGLFWYNRMDQSISNGLRVGARLGEELDGATGEGARPHAGGEPGVRP